MTPTICMGNLQRTNEYPGQGVRVLHGLRWKYRANGPIRFTPLLGSETLFFGDEEATLYALDMQEGTERWKISQEGESDGPQASFRSGALTNDTLHVFSADSPKAALSGFSLLDGRVVSRYERSAIETVISFPSIVQDLLIGADGSMVCAFDLHRRHLTWQVEGAFSDTPPAFDEQLQSVYVSGRYEADNSLGGLSAYDLRTGKLLWEVGGVDGVELASYPPLILQKRVYMVAWPEKGGGPIMYAYDTQTGHETWRHDAEHEGFEGFPTSGLAASQGTLYYGRTKPQGTNHEICALDIASRQLLWTAPVEEQVLDAPVLAEGVLYAATVAGALHAFDLTTGTQLWTFATQQAFEYPEGDVQPPCSPCCIAEHMVFFQAADTMYALY